MKKVIPVSPKRNLTIDDIARRLGVSKTTVSRAISGKGRISESTRAKVLDYIQACNYRPSAAAKGLAESRTYNVALVLPRSFIKLDQPFARLGMSAVCEEAFVHDYNVLICLSTDDNPDFLTRTLDNRKVDGVILSRTVENDPLVVMMHKRGIPFSTMGSLPKRTQGLATIEVDHDQVGGCYEFTKAVLSGCTDKIALLGNDMDYVVNQSRMAGFQKAVRELGIPQENILIRTRLHNADRCKEATDELLSRDVRFFITMDNEVCTYTMEYLRERNVPIPQQIRLASMYDSDTLRTASPSVTALSFDAAALGQVACQELLRYLRSESYDPAPRLGYRIELRESTK